MYDAIENPILSFKFMKMYLKGEYKKVCKGWQELQKSLKLSKALKVHFQPCSDSGISKFKLNLNYTFF